MRLTDVLYEADDPVPERRAQAMAVNEVLREPLSSFLDDQLSRHVLFTAVAIGGVVLGVVAIGSNAGVTLGGALVVGGLLVGGGGYVYTRRGTPDVTVTGIEKGYWTGYTIPDEEGVVVYDATETVESTTFDLERLSNEDAVSSVRERLETLGEFPVVMPRGRNIEEEFTETLEAVRAEIESAEHATVEAPVLPADGPEAAAVEVFATMADDGEDISTEVAVPVSTARADVDQLASLERMAAAKEGEAELERITERSRNLVAELTNAQETAIHLLNDHIGTAADAFGLVSYTFYCPDCQGDGIDSVVDLADPQAGEWYCETCRSRHETGEVIPRHRIKDDLVNPVWDQLWIEKDDQRREIYESIEDQKRELQEREFEQCREEIRSTTDRVRDLRSRIRDLKTKAKAAEGTVEEIGELMVEYDRLNEQRKQAFERDVQESFAEIDRETDRILEETRGREQQRMDEAERAAAEKAELIREEERRRQVEMHLAAQEREDRRAEAMMEQRAEQHEEAMRAEHRRHREEWMLETRGRTSFSGLIDRMKMKKDRILRATARDAGGGS